MAVCGVMLAAQGLGNLRICFFKGHFRGQIADQGKLQIIPKDSLDLRPLGDPGACRRTFEGGKLVGIPTVFCNHVRILVNACARWRLPDVQSQLFLKFSAGDKVDEGASTFWVGCIGWHCEEP